MLDKKKYYKIFGSILVATLLVYGSASVYSKNVQSKKVASQQSTQNAASAQNETAASASDLNKTADTSKPKDPSIIEYTVKASDTLESIASTYSIKQSTITASNGLANNTVLKEGQKLIFPSIDGVIYKIKGGETLWDLSNLYKLTSEEIIAANKLENPDKLKLGQALIIPTAEKLLALETNNSSTKTSTTSTSSKRLTASKNTVAINRGVRPASGSISSNFGERWGRDHNGVDIASSTGTNIYAYLDGKVSFSGWKNGYGNVVIINHGNGLQTYYGHCSKLLVKAGQTVSKGQHIAEVGSTGRSTGPHLHFEVRKNGVPVNPMPYLKRV